jgi:hypothetical protein
MKKTFAALLLAFAATGCVSHYDVVLFNGAVLTATSKPRLNEEGAYAFRDVSGKDVAVPRHRVRMIQPSSDASSDSERYGVKASGKVVQPSTSTSDKNFFLPR